MNSKTFLVKLEGNSTTRWLDGEESIILGLKMSLVTFCRAYTQGAVPCISIEDVTAVREKTSPLAKSRDWPE